MCAVHKLRRASETDVRNISGSARGIYRRKLCDHVRRTNIEGVTRAVAASVLTSEQCPLGLLLESEEHTHGTQSQLRARCSRRTRSAVAKVSWWQRVWANVKESDCDAGGGYWSSNAPTRSNRKRSLYTYSVATRLQRSPPSIARIRLASRDTSS